MSKEEDAKKQQDGNEEVKEKKPVEEKEQQKQQTEQTPDIKHYLFFINDNEAGDKIIVRAYDIMHALAIFAETYRAMCINWETINIYVEEITTIN